MNRMPYIVSTPASRAALHGRRRRGAQRGASLLEAIAYLGIAAAVVLGAVSLLNGAFGSAKSNQTAEEVVALRTAVRKLYMGQSYPADGMVANLLLANAVPATIVRGANGALNNSWGGAITVVGAGGSFTIAYANVPQDVCMNLVSGASGWTSIATGQNNALTTFPVTAGQAANLCGATSNNVSFTAS